MAQIVGFASDDDLAYTLSQDRELVALDLESGRARVVDTNVALAAVGPTGTPFAVRFDGSVATVRYRAVTPWTTAFARVPSAIWGAVRNRLVAVVADGNRRTLQLLGDGQPAITQPLPEGAVSVAPWGDLVAVPTDSGVVLLDPADAASRRVLPLEPPPRLVAISASAHRVYVVTAADSLTAFDRFTLEPVHSLALPGPVADLRADPMGQRLLLRPVGRGAIWMVDLVEWRLTATIPGDWDDRLPLIAPDGTVLLRQDGRLVALAADAGAVVGAAEDAGGDLWLPIAWDPRRPTHELADPQVVEPPTPSQLLYVQVSSTSNQDWAEDLARNLQRAGIPASVLAPTALDVRYRVVLGPYATHEEAQQIQRQINLPSWIFTRDTTRTVP